MPLYEYECTACGERTELIQRLSDPPLAECPVCGEQVKKLLSAPSFQFKGSGWYVTDYAGKNSGSKGGEADSGKSESSPAKTEKPSGSKKADASKSGD